MFIGGLIAASLWILSPFLGALIWAVMIVIPTWPLMRALQRFLWGRRWLAASAAAAILLPLLIVPGPATGATILSHSRDHPGWARPGPPVTLPTPAARHPGP